MEKKRKKLTDVEGETKVRNVWITQAKIGTGPMGMACFFAEPKVGVRTEYVPDGKKNAYQRATTIIIIEVNDNGLVYASKL